MMKDVNLILIDRDKTYEFKSFDELVEIFFGEEYKKLSFEEKFVIRFNKAFPITIETSSQLVDTRVGRINGDGDVVSESFIFSNAFIIDNEKTFILSILKFKNMLLLEKVNEKIFYIDGINKSVDNLEEIGDNKYIPINNYIDKLLLLNMKLK